MVHKGRKVGTGVVIVAAFLAGGAVGAALYYLFDETNPPNSEPIVPRVRIESGRIRGMITKGVRGRKDYAAFLGVPYARPPFGPLRFKSPQPVVPWEEERDSTRFGFACRQGRADKSQVGHEDCLHANVYTPWPKREGELLPVLVKVHGGSNTEQSAIILRPDYFVEEGLIVVTFNYRLNHFGFLNLDNEVAPGNVGFKDMVFALQWVQRNIHHFGGDPSKVTLQGCSSAAGAVHWLTLLPSTEGLFRGAIIMSGSGMTPWSYTERHRDVSDVALARLREVVPGASDEQLLQTLPADVLGIAFAYADLHRDMSRPETFMNPTVSLEDRPESETEPRLIKADAETYLLGGLPARSRVPLLVGIVQCEYTALADYHLLMGNLSPLTTDPEADRKLLAITPRTVIPTKAAQRALGLTDYKHTYEELEADIRETFFNTSNIDASCGMQCRWEAFFSETLVKVDTVRALRMDSQRGDAPVYAYRYEFPVVGTCPVHAIDDLVIWPIQNENLILDLNTTSPIALNILRQINFQANFVKEGNPVPKTDPVILTTEWSPMSKDSPDRFMRIGVNLTMDEGDLLGESGPYWLEMYSKYRDGKGT